jgi:ketose-bisphosphate aldolase
MRRSNDQLVRNAWHNGLVIPAFNIPYLPMMKPVVQAVVDQEAFALIATARIEWRRFESCGLAEVKAEFERWAQLDYVRLHVDHIPVIDEEDCQVEYMAIIQEALDLGYPSVMVDGSRLGLEDNIAATRAVVDLAHNAGVAVEAELGAVLGHSAGPLPPYEELYASGMGFTDVAECARYVQESGCDWLSVAIGNIHGAVSGVLKDQKKVEARLNIERMAQLNLAAGVPLVLHGGSGVRQEYLQEAIKHGIAKVNIGAEIRQAYERELRETGAVDRAQAAVYDRTVWLLRDYLQVSGLHRKIVDEETTGGHG